MSKAIYEIIKYTFWGVVLTVVLPSYTNFLLKRYDNNLTMNQVILTQGLQPYRTKQLKCSNLSEKLVTIISSEVDQKQTLIALINQQAKQQERNNYVSVNLLTISNFLKKIVSLEKEKRVLRSKFDFCSEGAIYDGQNTALLLGIYDKFNHNVNRLKDELRKIKIRNDTAIEKFRKQYPDFPISRSFSMNYIDLTIIEHGGLGHMAAVERIEVFNLLKSTLEMLGISSDYDQTRLAAAEAFYQKTNTLLLTKYAQRLNN